MYGVPNKSVKVAAAALSSLDLAGKSVAVLGGTSGLGRALALLAAAKGASVTVVGRSFKVRAQCRSITLHAAERSRRATACSARHRTPPRTARAAPAA